MSQFEPFAALAYRHTSALEQQAKKKDGEHSMAAQGKNKS